MITSLGLPVDYKTSIFLVKNVFVLLGGAGANRTRILFHYIWYNGCCSRNNYQEHVQVITFHIYCVIIITWPCPWYLLLARHSSYGGDNEESIPPFPRLKPWQSKTNTLFFTRNIFVFESTRTSRDIISFWIYYSVGFPLNLIINCCFSCYVQTQFLIC